MNFLKQIRFSSAGRCNRMDYFLSVWVFQILVIIVVGVLDSLFGAKGVLNLIAYIPLVILGLLAGIRRLHDQDNSGWLLLTAFIPFVNLFLMAFLLFWPGTVGGNRFGAPE